MGAGRKTETFTANTRTQPSSTNSAAVNSFSGRNLGKYELGGVIFGCTNNTMKECLYKKLFGLPAQHFSYVKNIGPGMPIFLFNYSDRTLHGIFEASSKGEMFIDPNAWVGNCSEITQYPAQVKVRLRFQCHPLSEDKFGKLIQDNYYTNSHFLFELDHRQSSKLMSLLASLAIAPGTPLPKNNINTRIAPQTLPSHKTMKESEEFETAEAENFASSSRRTCSSKINSSFDGDIQPLTSHKVLKEVDENEKNLIYMKLKELAPGNESQEDPSIPDSDEDLLDENTMCSDEKDCLEVTSGLQKKEEESLSPPFEFEYTIDQLMQEVEELTALKKMHMEKNSYLEHKLLESALEIQYLKARCKMLESAHPTGGFDGESWLSLAMDSYNTSQNVIKSMSPIHSSYAEVVGGGKVKSNSPILNNRTTRPSLNQKKGSLAGSSLNRTNGVSDVETLDLDKRHGELMKSLPIGTGGFNRIDNSKAQVKPFVLSNCNSKNSYATKRMMAGSK